MSRWTTPRADAGRALRALAAAGLLALGASAAAGAAQAGAGDTVLLAVRLNGVEQDGDVQLMQLDDGPAVALADWRALQLAPPPGAPRRRAGADWVPLAAARVDWRIDGPTQTLQIDAPASAFAASRLDLAPARGAAAASRLGGFANYDVEWQRGSGGAPPRATALIELGAFGSAAAGAGALRASGLLRSAAPGARWTRLDTGWTLDQPARLASLRVGDSISDAGAWGRALRFGGLQWGTDFSLQPAFTSFPLPSLQGQATLPSTVELYVNGSRRAQAAVPAGSFELSSVPVVTGQGELRLVVRDLLGREQVLVQPYYASPALLRPGLHAWSLAIGAERRDYGLASDRYGAVYGAVADRVGLDERCTREWRAEWLGRNAAVGLTGLWLLPAIGTLHLSGVASRASAGRGALLAGGAERQAEDFGGSLQLRLASRHFRQPGAADPDAEPAADSALGGAPRLELAAAAGGRWRGTGLGASLVQQDRWQGARQRLLAVNATRDLGRLGALALVVQRDAASGRVTVAASLSVALDDRSSASLAAMHGAQGGHATLALQRNPPDDTGFGGQLVVDRGRGDRIAAQGVWQGEHASLEAGVAHGGAGSDARLGARGGLAWLGDSVFASRRIDGSFAVVEVGDYAGVPVLLDHRAVATTDAHGRALVGGLHGYEPNRIGIDAAALPLDASVAGLETVVTPPAHSGVRVVLGVQRLRGASLRLVDGDGRPLPPGAQLQLDGQAQDVPVGFEGRAFVADLRGGTPAQARWGGRQCRVWLEPGAGGAAGEPADLGTLTCL